MKCNIDLKGKFLTCTIVPIVILSFMTILPIMTMLKGEVVYLEANVYNSSESLRGRNLTVQYKISQIDEAKVPDSIKKSSNNNFNNNVIAYVVLKPQGNVYDVDYVALTKPVGKKYLKCDLSTYNEIAEDNKSKIMCQANYNLDKFYNAKESDMEKDYGYKENPDDVKWNHVAKIKIYDGYSILEDVLPMSAME